MALLEKPPSASQRSDEGVTKTSLPDFDEEYFQWIDLVEAVAESRDRFTMIELGAGYGRWLANAAALLDPNIPDLRLIGVEAEPTHFRWMKLHLQDNRIDERHCDLHEAAIDAEDGTIEFLVGNSGHWYGQSIWPPETRTHIPLKLKFAKSRLLGRIKLVRAVSLNSLLGPLQRADLLDLDVQGSELRVLTAARHQLNTKVRRVHIGTHSTTAEDGLRSLFVGLGWESKFDYPCGHESTTPYGKISFQDGVQSWVNSSLEN